MMAETTIPRAYIPERYYDEVCPAGRPHPTAWIEGPAREGYWLGKDDENADYQPAIAVGSIERFIWEDRFPAIEIEITAEGYTPLSPDPSGNMYWLAGGLEMQSDTLDNFVDGLRYFEPNLVGRILVEVTRWAEQAEPWRLDLGLDGPCFVKVEV